MITKKIVRKDLQNAIRALSDNYIYMLITDDGRLTFTDSKITTTIEVKK